MRTLLKLLRNFFFMANAYFDLWHHTERYYSNLISMENNAAVPSSLSFTLPSFYDQVLNKDTPDYITLKGKEMMLKLETSWRAKTAKLNGK